MSGKPARHRQFSGGPGAKVVGKTLTGGQTFEDCFSFKQKVLILLVKKFCLMLSFEPNFCDKHHSNAENCGQPSELLVFNFCLDDYDCVAPFPEVMTAPL